MARTESEFKSILTEHDDSALAHVRTAAPASAPAAAHVSAPTVAVASASTSAHTVAVAPAIHIAPDAVNVLATYTFTASGSSSNDGAEAGKAVITVYDNHTMTVALTSLTPNVTSDGQNLSSLKMNFATSPPAATIQSDTGQLVDIDGHGGYTNIAGPIAHWGTAVSGSSLYLATVGTGALGGQPHDLITDTAGGSSNANSSVTGHEPQIANTATFTLAYTGTLPTLTGVNFGFGTDLTISDHVLPGTPTCFLEGTRIAVSSTASVEIESLRIGDLVLADDGRQVPVLWIGRQAVSRIFADTLRTMPIRIKAGALAENLPVRDLLVSNCHAIMVDGMLVQAGALVNGTSIIRETNVANTFTYYHLELEDHSLILAEGVAAETFVDNASRMAFDNWSEHEALFPEGRPMVEIDLPRVTSARQLPRLIREYLEGRAAEIGERILEAA